MLVRHEVPGGGFHYDWFVQDPRDPGGLVRSFRVASAEAVCAAFGVTAAKGASDPVASASAAGTSGLGEALFEAERSPDHRNIYLEYEGEISGGRGSVRRVAAWNLRVVEWKEKTLVLTNSAATRAVRGRCVAGQRWEFRGGAAGEG